jgi:hypothetical protein
MLTAQSDPVKLYQQLCKVTVDFGKALDACVEYRNQLAASKAEVKEIRAALGDDGRRTHKEILEMAFKASGWREWKQKYIDLNNAHIAEGQDPAGTIWEHADKVQKRNAELEYMIAKMEKMVLIIVHSVGGQITLSEKLLTSTGYRNKTLARTDEIDGSIVFSKSLK